MTRVASREIRALQPGLREVGEQVAEIIAEVRSGGDRAVADIEARVGSGRIEPGEIRQPEDALRSASGRVDPELIAALETAAGNIRASRRPSSPTTARSCSSRVRASPCARFQSARRRSTRRAAQPRTHRPS